MKVVEKGVEIKLGSIKEKSGLYKIINVINNKFYLGRASNFYTRYTGHLSELKRGVGHHKNSALRRAWLKYGENNFIFEVFLRVEDKSCLVEIEQKYLDALKPYNPSIGYNMDSSSIGFTTETAIASMKAQIDRGRTWKGENNGNAKLSSREALEIRTRFLEDRLNTIQLAEIYKVDRMTISDVVSGKSWGFKEDLRPRRLCREEQLIIGKDCFDSQLPVKDMASKHGISIPSIRRAINAYKQSIYI